MGTQCAISKTEHLVVANTLIRPRREWHPGTFGKYMVNMKVKQAFLVTDEPHDTMQAMRAGLQGTMRVKGLLEMMFEVLSDWIDAFIEDIEEVEASETGSTTPKGSLSPRDGRGEPIHISSRSQTWLPITFVLTSVSFGQ